MRILAIETSCDETSAAVVEKHDNGSVSVLASTVASSSDLHALTGGIIPERAAREQIQYIIPIILQALLESEGKKLSADLKDAYRIGRKILAESIDALAVTQGPGLIGSLLVGIEAAKTLSVTFDKPIIPVNHLLAHIYANFIDETTSPTAPRNVTSPTFPFVGLIVSGGHTDLLYFKEHEDYTWLGGTRDDAAGEALDKTGRLLGLAYPAGPEIEKRALLAQKKDIKFSRALIHSDDFDFSFSGLKTEVARFIQKKEQQAHLGGGTERLSQIDVQEISFAIQDAITDVLVAKTLKAAEKYNCKTIVLGGGVSANEYLRNKFKQSIINNKSSIIFFSAQKKFTTDNAAMIGAYAALNYKPVPWPEIKANPELYFD